MSPSHPPRALIVMGVCGAGKSSIGRAISAALDGSFIEADDYHPNHNVEAMRQGRPLTDEMRWPWLAAVAEAAARAPAPVVIACSALRREYRDLLRERLPGASFILLDCPPDIIRARMARRDGHFMPVGLLDSQIETFEPLTDEAHLRIDVSGALEDAVEAALAALAPAAQDSTKQGRKTA